jgi:hypothetical protein
MLPAESSALEPVLESGASIESQHSAAWLRLCRFVPTSRKLLL